MSRALTRRKTLKLIAASTVAAALSPLLHARARSLRRPLPPEDERVEEESEVEVWQWTGRAINTVAFYEKPSTRSARLASRGRDQSFPILREVRAPFSAHNDLWYETPLGYVHSAWVYPIRVYAPQPFVADVGEWGFWGEVSQVYTEALTAPAVGAARVYRFYGCTVYHVVDAFEDEQGTGWYKVYDEFPPTSPTYQWVLAQDVRRIPRNEMCPIRPFVPDKRIEADLGAQRLTCFEGDQPVFTTPIASGVGRAEGDPAYDLATHRGETSVLLKQASRHMTNRPYPDGPPTVGGIFDLPGIPWNTFFHLSGTAIHGTYWHNDFGIRRSHGCMNAPSEAARFIYRWVHPVGGYEDDFIRSNPRVGTPISIF